MSSRRTYSPAFTWLAVAAALLPACVSIPTGATSTHTWPTHGNQYYNYWDAKYLGSDSAAQLSYRLIDSSTFDEILHAGDNPSGDPNTIKDLLGSSHPITIDSSRIRADLQWVKDSSAISGREYQMYLYLDRSTAQISSVHGEPGSYRNSHPFIEADRNHGMVSPIPPDSPRNCSRILIGQVHGHPAGPNGITLRRMSPDDSLTAVALQAPIYAIDAMDGIQGTPGLIHRANPDPDKEFRAQDLCIGKTDNIFNIGLNSLRIWGISHRPDFDLLKKIDSANSAPPNTMASIR